MSKCKFCGVDFEIPFETFQGPLALCPMCERRYSFYLQYFHEAWKTGYFPNLYRTLNDLCLSEGYHLARFSRILWELHSKKQLSIVLESPETIRITPYTENNFNSHISLAR